MTTGYEVEPSITLLGTSNLSHQGTPQRTPQRMSQKTPTRKGQIETPILTPHPTITIMNIESTPEKTSQDTPPIESFETIERKMRFVQFTCIPSNFYVFTK